VVVGGWAWGARGQLGLGRLPTGGPLQDLAPGTSVANPGPWCGLLLCVPRGPRAGGVAGARGLQVVREGDLAGGGPGTRAPAAQAELAQLVGSWRQGAGRAGVWSAARRGSANRAWSATSCGPPGGRPESPCLAGHGSPYYQDRLPPLIDLLERHFALDRSAIPAIPATPEDTAAAAGGGLRARPGASEHLPVGGLLSIPLDERYRGAPRVELAPASAQGLLDCWSKASSARHPGSLLLVFQDLHWVDPSTVELLGTFGALLGAKLSSSSLPPTFKPLAAAPHCRASTSPAWTAQWRRIAASPGRTLPPESGAAGGARRGSPVAEELPRWSRGGARPPPPTTASSPRPASTAWGRPRRWRSSLHPRPRVDSPARGSPVPGAAGRAPGPPRQASCCSRTRDELHLQARLIQEAATPRCQGDRRHTLGRRLIEERSRRSRRPARARPHCSEGELARRRSPTGSGRQTAVERSPTWSTRTERGSPLDGCRRARDAGAGLQAALGRPDGDRGSPPRVEKATGGRTSCASARPTPTSSRCSGASCGSTTSGRSSTSQRSAATARHGEGRGRRPAGGQLGSGSPLPLRGARRRRATGVGARLAGAGGAIPSLPLRVHRRPSVHGYVLGTGAADSLERSREGLAWRELSDPWPRLG